MKDRRMTIEMLSEELKISIGSVHAILHDELGKRNTSPVNRCFRRLYERHQECINRGGNYVEH
ncbi:hypothetical protein WN55_09815 [Dufourea novaeangliae]|uniref:Histone-lysine N-methyltransferase SETMAR n=1 Tax=Dufourea novaeangliae TaxID=178035 RepID=A0A154P786_DUFNO|nr:hypothetical protein WN55_09815 [Dufourea novaeangliae]